MRESCKSGSVGEAAGDRRLYPTVMGVIEGASATRKKAA
jgi:hypothetical protein